MSTEPQPKYNCSYSKLVDLTKLKPNPENPNEHPPEQIERLAKVIAYQGQRSPIVVSNRSGLITKGHGRLLALKHLGWKQAAVDYQDYDSEEQEYADVVADNALSSWSELNLSSVNSVMLDMGPDFDIELLGIKDFVVEPAEKFEAQCDEDELPEFVEPKTKPGDIYKLGNHRLMCGDSTNIQSVEQMMGGVLADCVWTDPPYNVALGMETPEQAKARNRRTDGLVVMNDKMSDEDFRKFLTDAYSSMAAVTKPGGGIYVAHADSEGYNFRGAARDSGWLIKQCLIWKKSSLVMGRQDYHWIHEPILYGWKEGGAHSWYADRKQTTVLEFDKPSRNGEHPTMKPVDLVEYCLSNSTKTGDVVLDLFGGSGTTLIAAEKMNRSARLMELDPKYCDVIVARWEKYTGKQAQRIETTDDQKTN